MDDFIRNENLKLYRRALETCLDPAQRLVLQELLRLLIAEQPTALPPLPPPPRQIPYGAPS
ncbi:MAG: hypothetical protein HXX15_01010 [Rhodopseudomonas sp.]|uniref:hypothetical protein n=1 Tax=Rhodopseudomonas sp. TaxID=1078 RepID=UPI001805D2D0|nr:hypothetical protein [Rhodopseudomonas sp.]NVN84639.1 hypothetical protein [Rhodopseudomonas sp.]